MVFSIWMLHFFVVVFYGFLFFICFIFSIPSRETSGIGASLAQLWAWGLLAWCRLGPVYSTGRLTWGSQLFQPTATALSLFTWFTIWLLTTEKGFNCSKFQNVYDTFSESSQGKIRFGSIFFVLNLIFHSVSLKSYWQNKKADQYLIK